jgi:hypothetical protein
LSYSVGGLTVTTEPGTEFFVVVVGDEAPSNVLSTPVDTFVVGADSSAPIALESVFRLEDTTGLIFSDTELPAKLRTKAFDVRQFEVHRINPDGSASLMFVTSMDRIHRKKHPR